MTLQEAVKLLCKQPDFYTKEYLSASKKLMGRPMFPDVCGPTFNLKTIDGCLALGKKLGLVLEFNWAGGLGWQAQWHKPGMLGVGGVIRHPHPTELAAIQAALAAGIEHLYGVPT